MQIGRIKMKFTKAIVITLVAILASTTIAAGSRISEGQNGILYVKPGEEGDCYSWDTACDLQDALALADAGDQVWVAAGIYKPTTDTDRTATFLLESGVAIYGGFAGTETSLSERDWKANPTTLSGDLGAENTNADNSYHVVTANSANTATILDGFTISSGNANGVTEQGQGGGMRISFADIILSNITFSSNAANIGGGLYSIFSNPTLMNVNFYGNNGWSDGCGGGMYVASSNPTISNATFAGNLASRGGGMCSYSTSLPILTNVTFDGNTATNHGGGMYNNNSIPTLVNVTFSGNIAISLGGAIYNDNNNSFSPTLTNVTIFENTASSGGGIYNRSSYGSVLKNCILWDNTNGQIVDQSSTPPTITYSIIQGDTVWDGEGNLNADPLLESLWFNGGFTMTHALGEGSPAIDSGDPLSFPNTDQRGFPRPIDGDGDDIAFCDMGAYEYVPLVFIYLPLIVR
jgi:predicted outer membrane repeat protein